MIIQHKSSKKTRNPGISLTILFSACALICQSQQGAEAKKKSPPFDSIQLSINTGKIKMVGLPCPNSSTNAGGFWSYEDAEKRKGEIYDMALTKEYTNWKNPTSGGAIHITKNDEIEVYQFTLGIFLGRNDTAAFYTEAPKDTTIIVESKNIWPNVSGIGFGNATSVLLTSEIDLRKSKAIKDVLAELWKPGIQIYYFRKKE